MYQKIIMPKVCPLSSIQLFIYSHVYISYCYKKGLDFLFLIQKFPCKRKKNRKLHLHAYRSNRSFE